MLFGRYPFCDRTLVGLFIKIGRCRPEIPRTISLAARSLLRSLIRVKPDERLLSQDILGHVWFGADRTLGIFSTATPLTQSNVNEDFSSTSVHHPSPSHSSNPTCMNQTDNCPSIEDAVVPDTRYN